MNTNRNPQEKTLDFFVGHWKNTGDVSPGPFGPGGPVTGNTRYHWAVGERWLLYISHLELPGLGRYEVHGGVAFDRQSGRYDAFAVNSLGNLMVYTGNWEGAKTLVFTLVHPHPEMAARIVYRGLSDHPSRAFTMSAERVSKDGRFKSYFETRFEI
ncbi:DUF1579 family protein [Candidatus Bipolaricaulota bacterium]|nr:DUF1579 family protein [Candidatus Bipolaricaulota bacterium]